LNPNALIFTKIDEAATMGAVIEVMRKETLPIAYFTNGQKIPDDIEPAESGFIGSIVLPESKGE
jgi:flagellar biosynthesis protein FlhF